jgi:hypothetical protein
LVPSGVVEQRIGHQLNRKAIAQRAGLERQSQVAFQEIFRRLLHLVERIK